MNDPNTTTSNDDPIIQGIRLSDICNLILGEFNEAPIPSSINHLTELLTIICNKGLKYHIRHKDQFDPNISRPILYRYHHWAAETERWEKAARRSEFERKERFLREANIGVIIRFLKREWCIDKEAALRQANKWMSLDTEKRDIKLSVIGIKLIERFEDIP